MNISESINNIINKIKNNSKIDEITNAISYYNEAKETVITQKLTLPDNITDVKSARIFITLVIQIESIEYIIEKRLNINNYKPYLITDSLITDAEKKYNNLFESNKGELDTNELSVDNTSLLAKIAKIGYDVWNYDIFSIYDDFFNQSFINRNLLINFSKEKIFKIKEFYLNYIIADENILDKDKLKCIIYLNFNLLKDKIIHKLKYIFNITKLTLTTYPANSAAAIGGFVSAGLLSTNVYQNLINTFLQEHPIANTILGPLLRNPKTTITLGAIGTYLVSKGYPLLAKLWNKKVNDKKNEQEYSNNKESL